MATPGIGDPYWFEWYVGLKNIINMLNPDNGIEYVIFQCSKYNTIDDVVVGYKDGGHEICYQIKHEIFTSKTQNLTFGKLLEQETKTKPCLLCAIAQGWQAARASAENQIKPILYTNRTLGPNRATRTFNGKSYSSYPIKKFFEKVKTALNKLPEGAEVSFEDKTLQTQWEEMCAAIDTLDTATIVAFSKAFEIQGNQLGLLDTEHELITSLAKTFRTISKRIEQEQKLNHDNAVYMIENMCPYLADKTWRYEGFEDILKPLIAASNREGFWLLAKIIGQNLSEYNYQISVRNMQLLLNLFCCCEEPKLQNGLLAHEGALVEFGGDFAHINGASLFKVVGGNMFFYLCNSQIAPSEIWREGFKCVPDHTSPYCWRDENGNIVLRFERIASPIREAMHEKYYRQPILFRWLCNSEWLKETLCKHNLHLRYVSRLESIP